MSLCTGPCETPLCVLASRQGALLEDPVLWYLLGTLLNFIWTMMLGSEIEWNSKNGLTGTVGVLFRMGWKGSQCCSLPSLAGLLRKAEGTPCLHADVKSLRLLVFSDQLNARQGRLGLDFREKYFQALLTHVRVAQCPQLFNRKDKTKPQTTLKTKWHNSSLIPGDGRVSL